MESGEKYQQLWAVKVSEDQGKNWKLRVLCETCFGGLTEPVRATKDGQASSRSCDQCGRPHIDLKPPEREPDPDSASMAKAIQGWIDEQVGPEDLSEVVECIDLEVAYSPVIPSQNGPLDSAVEAVKLNDFKYYYEDAIGRRRDVAADELKVMRARYLKALKIEQCRYMVEHNPPDHIFYKTGVQCLRSWGVPVPGDHST